MNLFADSSALAKRYIAEEHSDTLDEVLSGTTNLAVSVLCAPEIISALCRRRRDRGISKAQYEAAKEAIVSDFQDVAVIHIVDEVLLDIIRLLESHALRASDAIQISSALLWAPTNSLRRTSASAPPPKLPALTLSGCISSRTVLAGRRRHKRKLLVSRV